MCNVECVDNHLHVTVWLLFALQVLAKHSAVNWAMAVATGTKHDPVHAQPGKMFVLVQSGCKCLIPAKWRVRRGHMRIVTCYSTAGASVEVTST